MHIVVLSISKMIVGNNIKECREPIMCLCQLLLVKMSYYKESTASERTSLGIDASQKQNLGGLCIDTYFSNPALPCIIRCNDIQIFPNKL